MCLAGAVVAFWSLTQEMTCLNPFTALTNILVTECSDVNENILGKVKYMLFTNSLRLSLNYTDSVRSVNRA